MLDMNLIMAAILAASTMASVAAVYVAQWHGSAMHRAGEAPTHLFTTKKAKP
jgi:hypothetical protein